MATIRIAIHRFKTFLGMEVLCIRSVVSYLSRSRSKKEGSIQQRNRSRNYVLKTRAEWQVRHEILNRHVRFTAIISNVPATNISMFFITVSFQSPFERRRRQLGSLYNAQTVHSIEAQGVHGASERLHPRAGVRTPSLMPRPSINATLANLDLNGFRFRLHGFQKMHVQHSVFEVRGHLAPIRILRK